jgi:FkbM family methyltransferase
MKRREFVVGAAGGVAAGVGGTLTSGRIWGHGLGAEGRVSYAQQGEDLTVTDLLHKTFKIDKPVYLDIGAADPVAASTTYLLYQTGGHGVLVEPNPYFVKRLKSRRPNDVVVAAGVGVTDQAEADYYVLKQHPMLNTFSKEQVEFRQQGYAESVVEKVLKIPLIGINQMIEQYLGGRAPDFLSIDIEGLDLAVLKTLDFAKYKPAAICAEAFLQTKPGTTSEIVEFLCSKGYIVRGATLNNTIFADPTRYV